MKAVTLHLKGLEQYAGHSVFLFGLFATAVDYVHATPLPPSYAQYTLVVGAITSILIGAENTWRKNLTAKIVVPTTGDTTVTVPTTVVIPTASPGAPTPSSTS